MVRLARKVRPDQGASGPLGDEEAPGGAGQVGTAELEGADPSPAPQPDLTVRCKACGHAVAHRRDAMEKEHTFRNPAGYSFHVVCFERAPGCLVVGPPTREATWFPGFAWSFALCEECQGHLGWKYQEGPTDPFFGLIATRLVRPPG